DGLMAFWNSPRPCPTHALDAVLAASEMGDAVAAATRRWRETHNYEVRVGVGINTGPVVVGSIGTEKLRQYTVIGSVVNLASRIEGINKTLGTSILLGEATYQAVADYATAVRRMGQIRGQEEPVTVYELVDCRAPDSVQSSGV
ncbi:MAG: adenylate/guanylate cyclase domain-containing protein, partial [Armatimonadetes bacterium]|nr:adenylate/guanylate cyclase domain-containing protein [Armatimonadota bacterium]